MDDACWDCQFTQIYRSMAFPIWRSAWLLDFKLNNISITKTSPWRWQDRLRMMCKIPIPWDVWQTRLARNDSMSIICPCFGVEMEDGACPFHVQSFEFKLLKHRVKIVLKNEIVGRPTKWWCCWRKYLGNPVWGRLMLSPLLFRQGFLLQWVRLGTIVNVCSHVHVPNCQK
jgi:hypothetical protein